MNLNAQITQMSKGKTKKKKPSQLGLTSNTLIGTD
jgi:hypothetical protein